MLFALLPFILPTGATNAAAQGPASFYISPTGSGSMSGNSPSNAAPAQRLVGLIGAAGPGGTVYLLADAGEYHVTRPFLITGGGGEGAPVLVAGVDRAGKPAPATFVSDRARKWTPAGPDGREVFRLAAGADHLVFQNLAFADVSSCFRVTHDVADIRIGQVTAQNVHYLLDDSATKGTATATIRQLVVRDAKVDGFAKGVARLQYDSSGILFENVEGDSREIDGSDFAIGIHLRDTVHDVVLRDVSIGNILDTTHRYWNGDGFATERRVHDVLFERTVAFNNSDAGYDLKSRSTRLVDARAEGNTRNFRFWANDTVAHNISGIDPRYHGGSNTAANVWIQAGASVTIEDSDFVQANPDQLEFDLKDDAHLAVRNVRTTVGEQSAVRLGSKAVLTGLLSRETGDVRTARRPR